MLLVSTAPLDWYSTYLNGGEANKAARLKIKWCTLWV